MSSLYPLAIDTSLLEVVNNRSQITIQLFNNLRAAIIAVEIELGLKPSGIYGTVRARLDALEAALDELRELLESIETGGTIFVAGGDLSGTGTSQTVIGLRGRSILSTTPISGQALVYNGTAWAPGAVTSFVAGGDLSGTETNQTVIRLQNRAVASTAPTDGYVLTWDNAGSTWKPLPAAIGFSAGGDLSGSATNQVVEKVHGATVPIAGSLTTGNVLKVSGSSTLTYGAINMAGGANHVTGNLPITNIAPSATDGYALVTVAGVPSWVQQIPQNNFEVSFVAGLHTTTSSGFDRIGARQVDMSYFPATIGSLTRTVTFVADIQKTSGATSVEVQIYDITHSVQVTSLLYATNTTLVEQVSSTLTVGSSSGNIRNDIATMYEVSMRMNGGVVGVDAVFCNNARLLIRYI